MAHRSSLTFAAVATCFALLTAGSAQSSGNPASVTYLGNEGVLVEQGNTRILFDPLFRLENAEYLAVPDHIENALVSGEPPFDGVDALMITHNHVDHFSPNLVLNFLTLNPAVRLYAPAQVIEKLQSFGASQEADLPHRATGLYLSLDGAPLSQETDGMKVEFLRIPHSGWPSSNATTQNLVYRITLPNGSAVIHLGDSEARFESFERFRSFWQARDNDLVLAPFWFMQSAEGQRILTELMRARKTVGIHVPAGVAEDSRARASEFRDLSLMVTPGSKFPVPAPTR